MKIIVCYDIQNDIVKGEVSLTCDAWQASNIDGYFAVSGHWIEEPSPGVWKLESALLGFTKLNNSHNGRRLGQTLFKIVDRLGIAHKVMTYYLYHSSPANMLICRLAVLLAIMPQTTM